MMEEREQIIKRSIVNALHFMAGVISTCNDNLCDAGFHLLTDEEEIEALEAAHLMWQSWSKSNLKGRSHE